MRLGLLTAGAVLALVLLRIDGLAHPGAVGVTWTGTVSRILERHCLACHGGGDGAPPQLDDYDDARAAAQAVKHAVLTRQMPRWHAVSGAGDFSNDPSLTPYQIGLLADWADAGAPRGNVVTPQRDGIERTEMAPPDLMLRVTSKQLIRNAVQSFELATGLIETRWVRGWAFQPGNRSLVRAAVMSIAPGASGTTLGTWVPGESATFLPDGVAQQLPAGSTIRLTIYYREPGGPAVDASGVGLYFSSRPPRELAHLVVPCGSMPLTQSIDTLAIRPAVGSMGSSLEVRAARPDRSIEPLGLFQDYPADQPQTYWFRHAVTLPRGSAIEVKAAHGDCRAELDYVVASGRVARAAANHAAVHDDAAVPWSTPASEADGVGFVCPMHPDIRAEVPGACEICRMTLVPDHVRVDGKYALDAELKLPHRVSHAGAPRALRLVVREPRTDTVVDSFTNVHERPFHLFIVSDDLRTFAHVHPTSQPDGSLELASPPIGPGSSQLFADFLPADGMPQLIRKTVVRDRADEIAAPRGADLQPDLEDKIDHGLRVRIEPESGALVAGKPTLIDFTLADAAGEPISDLEPYLGAWGHMFIVSADLADAVHSHPITALTSPGGPRIVFLQRFPRAGTYRLWAQFQRGGTLATVSFTVVVSDPR